MAFVPFAPALVAVLVYAVTYGLAETMRLPLRAPESRWQVPSTWVAGRTSQKRAVVWGVMLGPGVLTRNPYAGMWLVPLLLAVIASPALGAIAGGLVAMPGG